MKVAGLQRTTTIDFPDTLACVVFTPGCNLDCFYCHNRELIGEHPPLLDFGYVRDFLKRRHGLLDGVVVSGGEPTLQPDLAEFLTELRRLQYRIKLDTNGWNPVIIQHLLSKRLLDYVAVDYKAPEAQYRTVCGTNANYVQTMATIKLLAEQREAQFEVRTTLYPGLTGAELLSMAGEIPPMPRYRLNFYKVPAAYKAEDDARIHAHALTPAEIDDLWPQLQRLQPNLIR